MSEFSNIDPMVELFVHETNSLIEQLESKIIESEREGTIVSAINEIFRVMHTIKGNSMMMQFYGIANTAHALEDMFDFLRSEDPGDIDYNKITDLVLETVDYIKQEVSKIIAEGELVENEALIDSIKSHLESLKLIDTSRKETATVSVSEEQIPISPNKLPGGEKSALGLSAQLSYYLCLVRYDQDCEMVNIRAYSAISQLSEIVESVVSYPSDLEDLNSTTIIHNEGLQLAFSSPKDYDEISNFFSRIAFVKNLDLRKIDGDVFRQYVRNMAQGISFEYIEDMLRNSDRTEQDQKQKSGDSKSAVSQKYISVKVTKLDQLMNLVSELVVSESMVTRNPELENLKLDNFRKSAKQMKKIMKDLQDVVMEIRMVPLALTFQKMNRLARDMSNKTNKKIELELIGQETEVDKNIIEHISDPIMHLVRNAIDHGLENSEERSLKGKDPVGKVILEAKHSGGEILIMVRDDGKGLDKDKILVKAEGKGLLHKPLEEYTDEEAYELIFNAGFSTRDEITGFSGRGVGMDVVAKGIEHIGGQIQIKSEKDKGTEFTIRIPLTLAIIDCILVKVGEARYAVPITSIKQLFESTEEEIIVDPLDNEMIMVMNNCLKVIRIHEIHDIESAVTKIEDGIFVLVENSGKSACIFADKLLGEYQLVVKNFSKYINYVPGVSGCALLGDGGISLILDPIGLIN